MNLNDYVDRTVTLCGPGFGESDSMHTICQIHAALSAVYTAWRNGIDLSAIQWVSPDGAEMPAGRGLPNGPALDLADAVLDALVFMREGLGLNPEKTIKLALRRRQGDEAQNSDFLDVEETSEEIAEETVEEIDESIEPLSEAPTEPLPVVEGIQKDDNQSTT